MKKYLRIYKKNFQNLINGKHKKKTKLFLFKKHQECYILAVTLSNMTKNGEIFLIKIIYSQESLNSTVMYYQEI